MYVDSIGSRLLYMNVCRYSYNVCMYVDTIIVDYNVCMYVDTIVSRFQCMYVCRYYR